MSNDSAVADRTPPLRIGGAAAFWGDSPLGIEQLVRHGNVDVLVFDYLAELTMSLLARARVKNPEAGYATDFVTGVAPLLQEIAAKGIRLVSNAGGMNPRGCANALRRAADAAGVALKIAVVEGDDLMPRIDELRARDVREMYTHAPLPARVTSVNAYLGAFPIAAALARGADVVITGRCVDSAPALGALIHRFGWRPQDHDLLAAGSLVGHLLECTTQVTGGLYTDWWDVPDWANIGYPIAECRADGSFDLTKPAGTGGLVAPTVAIEQMLYEIDDPADYRLPDVRCDFTGVAVVAAGVDRVRIAGAKGCPPSPDYKVSATWHDGYRVAATLTLVGERAVDKARRVADEIVARSTRMLDAAGFAAFTETEVEILGSELPSYGADAAGGASREVVMRIACRHPSEQALGILAREIAPFGTAGAPGTTGFGGRAKPQPVFRLFSFLWPKADVPVAVELDGEAKSWQPDAGSAATTASPHRYGDHALPDGPLARVPLARVAVARSGDKGDSVNISVIARDPRFVPAIGLALTEAAVAQCFAHLAHGRVTRHDVPGTHAFNFVLREALGGGGAASLRNDALGKTFAQVLLSREIDIPSSLVPLLRAEPTSHRSTHP